MVTALRTLLPSLAWVVLAAGLPRGGAGQEPVDFATQVRPLLAARCHSCHGPDKQKAGLRLDERAAAMRGSWGGDQRVILPGDGAGSLLVRRIAGQVEGEDRMPPEGEPLSAAEVELLRRWIDEGAAWPADGRATAAATAHWSYRPVRRPQPPAVADPAWVRNPIDAFVLARLEREGLAPAPEADRATLLRRASLDLTGLPPTLAELDAFLDDKRPGAWERAVERLLASPHYGEHMARGWLDLARYADTNGYEKDDRRTAWLYRDWVIGAFDSDLPFDEFTILQLAGDLLPDATLEQRIATGFHRNTMVNLEGGADPEEFRVAAVVDRVNTTAEVWLGTTLACAQCHNHKYDPFSQREYYELFAFFDSTEDSGGALAPELPAPAPEFAAELAAREARVAELEAALEQEWPEEDPDRLAWEREARARLDVAPTWSPLVAVELDARSGAELEQLDDGVLVASGPEEATDEYTLQLAAPDGAGRTVHVLRLEVLREEGARPAGPGRAEHANFVLTGLAVALAGDGPPAEVERALASFEQHGFPVAQAIDDDPSSGWAVSDGQRSHPAEAAFLLRAPLELPAGGRLRVTLAFDSPHAGHGLGRFRLSSSASPRDLGSQFLPADVRAALRAEPDELDEAGRRALWRHHRREVSRRGRALRARLDEATALRDRQLASTPTALVMRELVTPRETHVLLRGSFLDRGERVERDVPAVLNPWPEGAPRDRLGLARWLVAPENPLTARVTVNRFWERIYGRGLVTTVDDFGSRGEPPSHPELLDWLAAELVERDWSVKALQRLLVTASTYRQSSRLTPRSLERDPSNGLLARGPRVRVEAEVVRDSALQASGLLERRIGGPSVMPPQPEGVWASTYSGDRWRTADDGDRWRRGLYTFHKRTSPYPTFMLFDGPSRELSCARRARTNTPLQALALLNDPAFVEAAVALARRALREGGPTTEARLEHAFRLCLARRPTERERAVLRGLLDQERARYASDLDAARALTARPGRWSPTSCSTPTSS